MGILRSLVENIYFRNDYAAYARYLGASVGDNCKILTNPRKNFGSEPWLIKIGDHVEITGGVKLLTHDGSIWVIRDQFPNLAVWGRISIGNNVFVGQDAIILPNISIGNNCVIGAGSVVTKNIHSNSVVAGCPARKISDYDTFKNTIKEKAIEILNVDVKDRELFCKKNYPELAFQNEE